MSSHPVLPAKSGLCPSSDTLTPPTTPETERAAPAASNDNEKIVKPEGVLLSSWQLHLAKKAPKGASTNANNNVNNNHMGASFHHSCPIPQYGFQQQEPVWTDQSLLPAPMYGPPTAFAQHLAPPQPAYYNAYPQQDYWKPPPCPYTGGEHYCHIANFVDVPRGFLRTYKIKLPNGASVYTKGYEPPEGAEEVPIPMRVQCGCFP